MLKLIRSFNTAVRLVLVAVIIFGLIVAGQPVLKAYAASFTVNRFDDNASASACAGAANDCSLRGAITKANNTPGADTIILPTGTYTLTLTGSDEDNNGTGDLDISDDLTIIGVGYRRDY